MTKRSYKIQVVTEFFYVNLVSFESNKITYSIVHG